MTEETLFIEASEITDPAERAAFLDRMCAGNADLRGRLDKLLARHAEAGNFLDLPALLPTAGAVGVSDGRSTADMPCVRGDGGVIGPYKLVEVIGEGGMGTVWLAQQHEPVKRLVALKVIKAGMDSRNVLARFEAERQALALMDHPNIAKVLDAGATAGGRPYFVMDLVKGIPITKFCDERRLTPRQRLELFVPVCQAVQHAHQKGVIHRDLKPSNILVALYDGRPVPKVIDFGVAKAAGQPLTEKTLVTGLGAVVGTPEYMSPEQAELNQLDVDTRSDIYSLGVLLYELLTGTPPLQRKQVKEVALFELLRLVREEEPPRPSNRISTTDELPTIAARRATEPRKLAGVVRGELDWIVMKALEKDRNRRYETAAGFAADVQRFLAGEAVLAVPPSAGYRLRKFARRNRRAVLTGSVAAAVVVLALVGLVVGKLLFEQAELKAARDLATASAEARSRLESRLYRQLIARAEREWSVNNLSRMEALLEQCPVELRDWEWHYLKRLRHSVQSPLRHEGPVLDATFSPDGQHLATSTQGGIVRIWQAETGQKVLEWQGHDGNVPTVRFSPDGRYLATGSWDNSVKVWDLEQVGKQIGRGEVAKEFRSWKHTTSRVWCVAFSPDGRRLASAGGKEFGKTGEVNVWNLETGQKVFPTQTFPWAVRGVQFSPDGQRLATACNEHVQMWDAQTGQEQVLQFPCHDRHGPLDEVAFSPDGRQIAAVGGHTANHPDREVNVWNATTGEEVFRLTGHVGGLRGVSFSPDGHRLVSSGLDQTVKVWDAKTGDEILTLRGHLDNVTSVAFSRDGCKLATASFDNTVRIWDGTPLEQEPTPEFRTLRGHVGAVLDVAFHPRNGNTLVSAGSDGTVREWDLQAGKELDQRRRTKLSQRPRVAYSPDGQRLAVSAALGGVHVWDATIGACPPFADHTAAVGCLTFSPGSRLVASADDSIVLIWDTTTAKKVRALRDDAPAQEVLGRKGRSSPNAIAISPDGRQLVTGSGDGILRVWDLNSTEVLPARRLPHAGRVAGVAFSPDGKRLASVSVGRSVKVWDTKEWKVLFDLPQPSAIQCVAFSPDGSRLVWGGNDGTVTVWDGPGTAPHVFRGHTSWIQAVKFSPDGEWIASASLDGTVKIWKAPPVAKTPAEVVENPGK